MALSIGAGKVSANLKKLADSGLSEELEKGLEKACLVLENSAKQNCPANTGQLRQSITHQVDGTEGAVGTNVEYAPYVEIGTGIYSTQGDGRQTPWKYQDAKGDWHTTEGMPAQPYLKPALDNNMQEVLNCFEGLL